MKYTGTKIILFLIFLTAFYSCSTTKKVPNGEFLLTKNIFEFESNDKPYKSKLQDYVKQRPNASALFGTLPLKLMLYNSVRPQFDTTFIEYQDLSKSLKNRHSLDSLLVKNGLERYEGRSLWLKRFIFNQGEAPVLIDTAMTSFSEENLKRFYFDRGYFEAEVESTYKLDSTKRKGKITYKINPGEVSLIESYDYEIADEDIRKYYENILMRSSRIKPGKHYEMNDFIAERDRISNFLKNRGYWRFNDDGMAVEFTADTTNSSKKIEVTLLIPPERNDSVIGKTKFYKYRYNGIDIYPDSDPVGQDNEPPHYYDTIYDGYRLRYTDPKMKYRPKFFTDAMVIRDSTLYNKTDEDLTKRNFSKRTGVSMTRYLVTEDTVNLIEGDRTLNPQIYFRPQKKFDMLYGLELSWSEFMNFGVTPSVSLVARNLFGGGENLETTVKGTMGNVNKKFTSERNFFNAFELSLQSKLAFPYLLLPFNSDNLFPKRYYKQTDLRLGALGQKNIGLGRINYSTGLDYNISYRDTHSHLISLANIEFVNNLQKDNYFNVFEGDNQIKESFLDDYYFVYNPQAGSDYHNGLISDVEIIDMALSDIGFLNSLQGEELDALALFGNMEFRRRTITQDVLIASLIYQFTYNQSERSWVPNPWLFRGRVEVAGNIPNLLDKAFGFSEVETSKGKDAGTILGVPYSQFVKFDVDVRKYFKITTNSTLATRAFLGIVIPFGNTDFVPFVRSYTAGGANDVRAWSAATLGPSDFPRHDGGNDVFAIESMKLLFSAEYRFNIMGRVNSAFFIDAGNIWGTDKNEELTVFKFNKFYKELGIGSGFGLRFDFTYLLLRLDFAYKIHDPSYPMGERWRLKDFNILKPHIAFGINYPF